MRLNVTGQINMWGKKNKENGVKRPELIITLFNLAALGVICSFFLVTLLALLIFLYLTDTGILGMMGLKTLSFSKARSLFRVT
jgi:hypothetical protein